MEGKDKPFVGIRELYKGDNDEWLPSQKGVTFPAEYIEKAIEAIDEAIPMDVYPDGGKELAVIPKNSKEQVRITATKYLNKEYVDFRIYFTKDDEYHPTKKGVTIPPDCLEELREGLTRFN